VIVIVGSVVSVGSGSANTGCQLGSMSRAAFVVTRVSADPSAFIT
jgi:hypothetical protein